MSKAIKFKTFQSENKKTFDEKLNIYLDIGWSLVEGGYEVIRKNKKTIYSQALSLSDDYRVEENDNKITGIYKETKEGKPDGRYTTFHQNGQIYEIGSIPYKINKEESWDYKHDGPFFRYDENGCLIKKGNYSNGTKTGEWEKYFEKNRLEYKGSYYDGIKTGKWEYYHNKGQISHQVEYYGIKVSGTEIGGYGYTYTMRIGNDKSWYENGRLRFEYFRNIVDEGKDFILLETKCKQYAESSYENDDTNDEDRSIEKSYDSHFTYIEKYEHNDEVKYSERNDWYVGDRKDENKEYYYSNDGVILKETIHHWTSTEINTYVENIPQGSKDRPKKDDHRIIESRKVYQGNLETTIEYKDNDQVIISMIKFYGPRKIKQKSMFTWTKKEWDLFNFKSFVRSEVLQDLPLDFFIYLEDSNDENSELQVTNYDKDGSIISEKKGIDK